VFTEKIAHRGDRNYAQQLPSIAYGVEDGLSTLDQVRYANVARILFDASDSSFESCLFCFTANREDDVHDLDSHLQSTEDIKEQERQKAQTALLESLQVEALWKISKIDLDRTIQEACNLKRHPVNQLPFCALGNSTCRSTA
jgi:hypothetical protein